MAAATRRRRTYETHTAEDDGWTGWVYPNHDLYRMACCDCGLVHDLQFRVTDDGHAEFRVRRNNRSTAVMRRQMKPTEGRTFLQFATRSVIALFDGEPPAVGIRFARNLLARFRTKP